MGGKSKTCKNKRFLSFVFASSSSSSSSFDQVSFVVCPNKKVWLLTYNMSIRWLALIVLVILRFFLYIKFWCWQKFFSAIFLLATNCCDFFFVAIFFWQFFFVAILTVITCDFRQICLMKRHGFTNQIIDVHFFDIALQNYQSHHVTWFFFCKFFFAPLRRRRLILSSFPSMFHIPYKFTLYTLYNTTPSIICSHQIDTLLWWNDLPIPKWMHTLFYWTEHRVSSCAPSEPSPI